jgi:hypothetical protein
MSRMKQLSRIGVVASALALGACAPMFGPGVEVGLAPGDDPGLYVSSCTLNGVRRADVLRMSSPSRSLGNVSRIRVLQSKRPSFYDATARRESWKRIATGEC